MPQQGTSARGRARKTPQEQFCAQSRCSNLIASGETVQLQAAAQLPAFHGLCRVHAPLYRVAADGAFFCQSRDDARRALDLAYADVRSAFEHFLLVHNQGRPFILAAHGQVRPRARARVRI